MAHQVVRLETFLQVKHFYLTITGSHSHETRTRIAAKFQSKTPSHAELLKALWLPRLCLSRWVLRRLWHLIQFVSLYQMIFCSCDKYLLVWRHCKGNYSFILFLNSSEHSSGVNMDQVDLLIFESKGILALGPHELESASSVCCAKFTLKTEALSQKKFLLGGKHLILSKFACPLNRHIITDIFFTIIWLCLAIDRLKFV